jgi:hypothetical protein
VANARRRRRSIAAAIVLVIAVAGTAQAGGPSSKYYSLTIAPTTAAKGSTAPYDLTLTNSNTAPNISTQTLGSANVTVPSGFSATTTSVTAPGTKSWTAGVESGTVKFRAGTSGDALAPGESVTAHLSVTTSCSASSGAPWTSTAKQANNFSGPPGNDFVLVQPDPALTVTGGGGGTPVTLEFVQQPSLAEAGSPISPAVSVRAVDECGQTATGATGSVSLTLSGGTAGATASGATASFASGTGVATFSSLTVDLAGTDYRLTASSPGLTSSAPSTTFDVVDFLCTSDDPYCEAQDGGGTTHVRSPAPPTGGTMSFTFTGAGGQFTCGDVQRAVIGSQTIVDPQYPQASQDPIQLTFTYDKSVAPGTGVANFVFCLSKDDGQSYFIVKKCGKRPQTPCELSRSRTGVGDLEIVVLIAPDDPIGSLG